MTAAAERNATRSPGFDRFRRLLAALHEVHDAMPSLHGITLFGPVTSNRPWCKTMFIFFFAKRPRLGEARHTSHVQRTQYRLHVHFTPCCKVVWHASVSMTCDSCFPRRSSATIERLTPSTRSPWSRRDERGGACIAWSRHSACAAMLAASAFAAQCQLPKGCRYGRNDRRFTFGRNALRCSPDHMRFICSVSLGGGGRYNCVDWELEESEGPHARHGLFHARCASKFTAGWTEEEQQSHTVKK